MKREHVYIAVAIFLALFLVVVSFDNSTNFTGRVIDENATNQTSDNQTTTTNQTETTNQTTETNQTDTTSQSDTTTQDDSSQTTGTTSTTTTTTTTDEEESDVQVQVNQTEPQESEVDRILRELEEQGLLEGSQPEQPEEQPSEQQSEEEAPTLTGSAIEESNETTCEGCLLKEECYAFNERKKGDYCLENKSWSPQIAFNEICAENFECRSNSCVGGQCTQVNILQLLIDWVSELFNIGSSGSSNITNFSN